MNLLSLIPSVYLPAHTGQGRIHDSPLAKGVGERTSGSRKGHYQGSIHEGEDREDRKDGRADRKG